MLAVFRIGLYLIVVLLAVLPARQRRVSHPPGVCTGAIRIGGDVPGLGAKRR